LLTSEYLPTIVITRKNENYNTEEFSMFFRNKKIRETEKKIEKDIACKIISAVCEALPDEFDYLSRQFNEGLILVAYIPNAQKCKNGFRQFAQEITVLNKYDNKKIKDFIIDNIFISDFDDKKYKVSIIVASGTFIGYSVEVDRIAVLDATTICAESFKIKYIGNVLEELFTVEELEYLNSSDIYEVELENEIYYHLFDLEDGDFIGMDKRKRVFEITHDPYEIVLIDNNLLSFLKKQSAIP